MDALERLKKRREISITKMSDHETLDHISQLIDDSRAASYAAGAKRAIYLLDELSSRDLADVDGALVEYFRANAWAALSHIANVRQSWVWEAQELQEELLALSRASNHCGFAKLDKIRQCQILTNQGCLLNTVGRTIDALAVWDLALSIMPGFAMARGNRGLALEYYAGMAFDSRERAILALHAFESFDSATADDAFYESADPQGVIAVFASHAAGLAGVCDIESVRKMQNLERGDEGGSRAERAYRRWCLDNRLFLCALNDLGPYLAAATDDLMLPPIVEELHNQSNGCLPPAIIGFFNQIKQEYVSARYMLYEGISSTAVHFSDRNVALTDTLDYPLYSLASERVRTAFRVAYSLLDKVAFLVDQYWSLGKKSDKVSFKNVWMVENKARLLARFENCGNLSLRGLYWLSKEIFDDQRIRPTAAILPST